MFDASCTRIWYYQMAVQVRSQRIMTSTKCLIQFRSMRSSSNDLQVTAKCFKQIRCYWVWVSGNVGPPIKRSMTPRSGNDDNRSRLATQRIGSIVPEVEVIQAKSTTSRSQV